MSGNAQSTRQVSRNQPYLTRRRQRIVSKRVEAREGVAELARQRLAPTRRNALAALGREVERADGLDRLLATYKQRLAQQQRWETALLRGMIGTLDQPTRAQVLEAAKRHGYLKRDESEDNDA